MSIYTLTRGELVLRYTPTLEGGYLAEASTNGGITYISSQPRTKEQVDGVVNYCHTQTDIMITGDTQND